MKPELVQEPESPTTNPTRPTESQEPNERLKVSFHNVREIRMGSPYNLCEIEFAGEWVPPLPNDDWQDLKAHSPDGRYLALVQWNTAGNIPGFHIVRIDIDKKKFHKTKRIMGLCKKLFWENGTFRWTK